MIHWVNALGFFMLLATGLILYLPSLSILVGRRPLIKDIHFWSGIGWIAALALVAVAGDRRGLLRMARELDPFATDATRCPRPPPPPPPPLNPTPQIHPALN